MQYIANCVSAGKLADSAAEIQVSTLNTEMLKCETVKSAFRA